MLSLKQYHRHHKFDGWYTAKVGGEKVTEDTVFNGYTILYDRWTAANIANEKIITAIEIPNSALVNGYTEIEYINASSAVNMDGVINSKVYAVYNGLNAYGSQVTGAETIDTSKDYSVVTTVKLQDGYYFAPNISLTAQHGVRAGVTYRAIVDGVGVTTNTWNNPCYHRGYLHQLPRRRQQCRFYHRAGGRHCERKLSRTTLPGEFPVSRLLRNSR